MINNANGVHLKGVNIDSDWYNEASGFGAQL